MKRAHIYLLILVLSFGSFFFPFQAKSAERIKIAAIFAKTGMPAKDGLYLFQAVRFAVHEINSKGGLLGKQIELLEYDNHGIPVLARKKARKAIKENPVAVIGAAWSSLSMAIAPEFQKAGIPMISPVSTNPEVTKVGNYIFRACYTDAVQGRALAQFARQDLQAETAVIFTDITSDYSLGFTQVFKSHFIKLKGKILQELEYKHREGKFIKLLARVKQLSPDILFTSGHAESGQIVKRAQEMGITSIMIGGDGWEARDFLVEGGLELKQGYFTTHWSDKVDNPISKDFIVRYRQYNEINALSALAYDAVNLLATAIRQSGSVEHKKVRDSLAQIRDFQGVTGKISFDDNGDPIKSIVIKKIVNGQVHYLKTIEP